MWVLPWRLNCCLAGWWGRWGDVYPPPLKKTHEFQPWPSNFVEYYLKKASIALKCCFLVLWIGGSSWLKCPPTASSQVGSLHWRRLPISSQIWWDAGHSWGWGFFGFSSKIKWQVQKDFWPKAPSSYWHHHGGAGPADWIKPSPGVGIFWVWNKWLLAAIQPRKMLMILPWVVPPQKKAEMVTALPRG